MEWMFALGVNLHGYHDHGGSDGSGEENREMHLALMLVGEDDELGGGPWYSFIQMEILVTRAGAPVVLILRARPKLKFTK